MIHFYSMEKCGYCAKAKEVLAAEIASGFVVIKDAKEAKNVGGFPHFVATTTGTTHTGFMADKEKLFEKLGVKKPYASKENYTQAMIHFYSMEKCGYCAKAKEVLAAEIASGFVVIKDAKEAKNVGGFPHFVATTTGTTHTGFMADKEKLFEKLGVKQNKQPQHVNQPQHVQSPSKQVENCSSVNGGYLSLSQTWSAQKRYVA